MPCAGRERRPRLRRALIASLAAALVATGLTPALAQTSPSLSLDPSSGPAGSVVSATGYFGGYCGVRFRWEGPTGAVLAEVSPGPDGNYAASVTIPGDATPGLHTVLAIGLSPGRTGCTQESSASVRDLFEVTVAPTPRPTPTPTPTPAPTPTGGAPVARLTLPDAEAQPGEGVVLDGGDSLGSIATFGFDTDGNGTYETECDGSKALTVQNQEGSVSVGLKVTAPDGQVATDSAVLTIVGGPVVPPPGPDGGSATPFQEGTVTATCVDAEGIVEATMKAWYCPSTLIVGVAEATFRKSGINPADDDACFERHEEALFGSKFTFFVATKNVPSAVGNPVRINGLEFDHPWEVTYSAPFYRAEIALIETIPLLTAYYPYTGKPPASYFDFRVSVNAGVNTGFASEPFSLFGMWDISKPGVVGSVTMGKENFIGVKKFLGLNITKKLTPITFTSGRDARFNLFVALPFTGFKITAPTSSIEAITNNNGGIPTIEPASASQTRVQALDPSQVPLTFTGIKLGVFTLNATVKYEKQGTSDVWSGDMELIFPGGTKVDGTLVIKDGEFASAHFGVGPGPPIPPGGLGPIGCCVWIYELFGDLTPLYVAVGAIFGIGPTIPVIEEPVAEVNGQAQIFYGDPWAFVLQASSLRIAGIPVNAATKVLIKSSGFWTGAFLNEDWGVLDLSATIEASLNDAGDWMGAGGGSVCVDIEVLSGCGGGYAGVGEDGVAACAEIPYIPDGGVALEWDFFAGDLGAWDMWWGCSFGDVTSEVTGKMLARARRYAADGLASAPVSVPSALSKVLFVIEGVGGPPKVTLSAPDGTQIASSATEAVNSGAGWDLIELPHDDTTYVTIESPPAGDWQVTEQAGSPAIASIGIAEGHPGDFATGTVSGTGRKRTLDYKVARGDVEVIFVETGGDPDATDPGAFVEQTLGTVGPGSGEIDFVPAEGGVAGRTIEARILMSGMPIGVEEVATYTAPELTPLAAPDVSARRKSGALAISWTKIVGAATYRVEVNRGDGPTTVIDVPKSELSTVAEGIGPLTSATVGVQAISEAGYMGEKGTARVKALPALSLATSLRTSEVLKAGGFRVRCVPRADGVCKVVVRKRGTIVARGKVAALYGERETFKAKLTSVGTRLLRRTDGAFRLTAVVSLPSAPVQRIRLRLN